MIEKRVYFKPVFLYDECNINCVRQFWCNFFASSVFSMKPYALTFKAFFAMLLIVVLFAPHQASAQTSRLYLAGYLGLSTFNDLGFSDRGTNNSGDMELDNGTSFAGAIGLRLSRNTRL